uniref:Ion transport domain-containing protein n=2 Tax=Ditylum brightwellii TaxID=49249 RepID=A0A6V2DTS6_9STRA
MDATSRESIYNFLEKNTTYEKLTIFFILLNVVGFIVGTFFNEQYNPSPPFACGSTCDSLWFGNDETNALSTFLNIGSTSVLELITVCIFTVDYILRLWTADLEHESYKGLGGRIRYMLSLYPLVDLVSLAPFYINSFIVRESDFESSFQWVRALRLFRMLRVEGRYDLALGMLDDVFYEQRGVLGVALFVGATIWLGASSLYYIAERDNPDMIYCGAVPNDVCDSDAVDVSMCTIDEWGFVDCTLAGCPPTDEYPEPCFNLYRSIPSASYFTLLNLFGEYPMIDSHSFAGKIVGTIVAVIAVAVFALPAGIVGNGFEDVIARRREEKSGEDEEEPLKSKALIAGSNSLRGRMYNVFHSRASSNPAPLSGAFEYLTDALVIITALGFMLDTVSFTNEDGESRPLITLFFSEVFDYVEVVSAGIFTYQYIMQVYSISENPDYNGLSGRIQYVTSFIPLVDLLSFLPFWINAFTPIQFSTTVRCVRLLRILRFDRYTNAFSSFDDVLRDSADILAMTGFTALVLWVFFSVLLYFSERDNHDEEVASYYRTIPHAMWVTLLNLAGESPLSNYTVVGKVATGIIGLFASGLFGIPIGVLGAGFEELVEEEDDDNQEEEEGGGQQTGGKYFGTGQEHACFCFVNGEGSKIASLFELLSHSLCLITVVIGIVQTVPGWENFLGSIEWIAVIFFTIEYALRLYGAPSDPDFGGEHVDSHTARICFVISFFSFVDLLGIAPFYFALAFPNSWIAANDFYLRLFRIVRLIKLDKYFPSITLIDDVVRLKRKVLTVTGFAAVTLWIIFAAFLYLAENLDTENAVDPVPVYGCGSSNRPAIIEAQEEEVPFWKFWIKEEEMITPEPVYEGLECTMSDRFQNFFDSMIYTGMKDYDFQCNIYSVGSFLSCHSSCLSVLSFVFLQAFI